MQHSFIYSSLLVEVVIDRRLHECRWHFAAPDGSTHGGRVPAAAGTALLQACSAARQEIDSRICRRSVSATSLAKA